MTLDEDRIGQLNLVLAILLKRAGGKLSFSAEELADIKGTGLVYDDEEDAAGFTHLYLIPDYVALGEEAPEDVPKPEKYQKYTQWTDTFTTTDLLGQPVKWGWNSWDPAGQIKEISVTDAPKESKPAKTSDVKKVR